jgi:CheY-like chemotaxis protein
VAKRLRSDARTQGLYLVALTGYGRDEDRRRSAEAGFDEHVTKPIAADSLARILNEACRLTRLRARLT